MSDDIEDIAIDKVVILNPRTRNRRSFKTIVANIDHIGLKRPITVTPRDDGKFDLVCAKDDLKHIVR